MFYFQFNIGDYASHTRNLSLLEDLAYRRLLDEYYLHEHSFNESITYVARQIGMTEHQDSVEYILNTYFVLTDSGWSNPRADKEIAHFHSKIQQASNAGKASAERRRNIGSTTVQPTNNQEPITNNNKTNTKIATPDGVTESVWIDFLTIREAKNSPITATALSGIVREAEKAGWSLDKAIQECITRGWQSFKADWVQQRPNRFDQHLEITVPGKPGLDPTLARIIAENLTTKPPSPEIKRKLQELRGK